MSVTPSKTLDVITIGRSSVDLYGAQVGGRLEDMGSFQKYIGGSPTNMACGTARLGMRSALITRVGDEHMGRFIRAVGDGGATPTTGEDGLRALALADAALKSVTEGRAVKVSEVLG